MKKIMILGASILQLPAIKKAQEMGLLVVIVDMNPDAIGFKEKNIEKEIISTIDKEKVLIAAKKHNIDGIMTLASDMPMRTVAYVAKKMNLVGIDEKTALNATNKFLMREALKKRNIPIPQFFCVKNINECLKYSEKLIKEEKSIIIKPVDNSGSRGIFKITEYDKEKIIEAYKYSKSCSRCGNVLIEEFMNGPEVSVETLSIDGVCIIIQITDKLTSGAPFFVEMGHSQPTTLSKKIKDDINKITIEAVNAIGIKDGPSHTEIIITEEGPKIVELGARLGGDNITTHLVPLSTGVNMVEKCIKIALGEKITLEKKEKNASAIRYFDHQYGIIDRIEGIEIAKKINGVKQICFVKNIGDEIFQIKNSSDRIGFVISQAKNSKDAIKICNEAISNIKIYLK